MEPPKSQPGRHSYTSGEGYPEQSSSPEKQPKTWGQRPPDPKPHVVKTEEPNSNHGFNSEEFPPILTASGKPKYGRPEKGGTGKKNTTPKKSPYTTSPKKDSEPSNAIIHPYFMAESIRKELMSRAVHLTKGSDPDDPTTQDIPRSVNLFHSLSPLEDVSPKAAVSKVYNVPTQCYKASDGSAYYALRRVDVLLNDGYTSNTLQTWKTVSHPSLVSLKDVSTTLVFGGAHSLILAYDYYPGAVTVEAKYHSKSGSLSEEVLWSYLIQLLSALKAVHSAGLAARMIHPSKVLVVGMNRIRLNCVGLEDVLDPDKRPQSVKQLEDLAHLANFVIKLVCPNELSINAAMDYVNSMYSPELNALLVKLLSSCKNSKSASSALEEVQQLMGCHILKEYDKNLRYTDTLEKELTKELDNGRLFRLVVKLGFINERPEYDMSDWSDTGDRYLLKLFRDFVFHQVDDRGNPVLDFAHVVESLNKLDIGTDEKVMLASRDDKHLLITKYKDLKRCIAEAVSELSKPHTPGGPY